MPAQAYTGGGGKSEGGGIQHFSAIGVGMAVGRTAGGGTTVRHGFLVGAAGRSSDEEPPTFNPPPGNIRQSTAADRCTASVRFPAINAEDNRDRNPVVTVTLLTDPPEEIDPAGEVVELEVGSYDVLVIARDRAGNEVRATFRVDVVDEAPPIFRAVPDPTPVGGEVEAQSPAGTVVAVDFECVDACDPDPEGTVAPRLARYPVGDTALRATCEDANGNTATADLTIRVRDTSPPRAAAQPAPIEVECESAQGATVEVPRVVWTDNGTPAEDLEVRMILDPAGVNRLYPDPPAELQLARGRHILRFLAVDASDNEGRIDVVVDVSDNGVPNVRVVSAPGEAGWSNEDGQVEVVLEVADGCSANNDGLEVNVGPPPDAVRRDGNRIILVYEDDGVYELAITVEDEDGNVTRDNSVAFGIDRTPPQPIFRAPGQGAVNAQDEDSFPIFARAERLPIDFGGEDGGDGVTSGVRSVEVIYDPDGRARVLANVEYDGNGNPGRGDRLVAGVDCANPFALVGGVQRRDNLCDDDGNFDLRYLDPDVHVIEVVVTDFAGNEGRGRARFISADLNEGATRIMARINALQPVVGAAGFARLRGPLQNLARVRDATDRRIPDSPFDSSVFLGTALRAAQTATIQLVAATPQVAEAARGELTFLTELLQRVSRSDVVLLGDHVELRAAPGNRPAFVRRGEELDLDFAADFIGEVDQNLDNDAWNDAAANILNAYFHMKSALEGWLMDYNYFPNHAIPLDIQAEYARGLAMLQSIAAEMDAYVNEGLSGANTVQDIRRALAGVIEAIDILVEEGFDPDGGGDGLSDQRYMEELLELRSVANRTTLAGNNGVWVRNYQWSMMQLVRFMTQSSVEDAIFTRGGGRAIWPIYERAHELFDAGVEMLDERQVQTVIDLYGRDEDAHCLLFAVYHCDFLDDEGENDQDQPIPVEDIPNYCWDDIWRPVEWAGLDDIGRIPPQCQWGAQVER